MKILLMPRAIVVTLPSRMLNACSRQRENVLLKSPDGSSAYCLKTSEDGAELLYSIDFKGEGIVGS